MKVAIVGLGFRMSHVAREFKKADPVFSIAGYVDPGKSFTLLDEMFEHGADKISVGRC